MRKLFSFILILILFSSCSKKDESLFAWWSFDSAENGIVKDMSGNGFDAICRDAVFGEGKSGKAFLGDGKGYLEVRHSPSMDDFKNGITITLWIYRERDSGKFYNCVVTREVRDTWSEYFDIAVLNNKPLFAIDADGLNYKEIVCPDSIIGLNKWYHLAGTFDNQTMRLYIDGKEVTSLPNQKPFKFDDQNPLIIGSNTNDQGKEMHDFFFGYIDDLMIYSRILSEEEIREMAK